MQSNINFLKKHWIILALSFLRNRSADTFRLLQVFILDVLRTYPIVVSQIRKFSKPYKTWLGWTSAFTSILILDQMILRSFLIPLDFWYPHVVAVTFFSTTSLWLLVVSEGKMKELASIISPPD